MSNMAARKTLLEFRVLHDGWEMDNAASVVEDESGKRLILWTNHGARCLMSIADLDAKIAETERSLAGLKQAKALLTTELSVEIVGSGEPPCPWSEFAKLNEDLGAEELAHIKAALLAAGECLHNGGAGGVFHIRRVNKT